MNKGTANLFATLPALEDALAVATSQALIEEAVLRSDPESRKKLSDAAERATRAKNRSISLLASVGLLKSFQSAYRCSEDPILQRKMKRDKHGLYTQDPPKVASEDDLCRQWADTKQTTPVRREKRSAAAIAGAGVVVATTIYTWSQLSQIKHDMSKATEERKWLSESLATVTTEVKKIKGVVKEVASSVEDVQEELRLSLVRAEVFQLVNFMEVTVGFYADVTASLRAGHFDPQLVTIEDFEIARQKIATRAAKEKNFRLDLAKGDVSRQCF